MRITSSQIGMESARQYSSVTLIQTGNLNHASSAGNQFFSGLDAGKEDAESTDVFSGTGGSLNDLYDSFQSRLSKLQVKNTNQNRNRDALMKTIKQECLDYIFLLLFGKKKKQPSEDFADLLSSEWGNVSGDMTVEYVYQEQQIIHMEQENTSFSTTGTVRTADGRELSFNLDFAMSRSFSECYTRQYQVAQVQVCDPLVINLEGNIAELSDQKFLFDLDQDGKEDSISRLKHGSGFLAFDKNQDGTINDGGELFGASSGDGFQDLRFYDEDGNGWIDEADGIFEKLVIWTQDEGGNDVQYRLKEAGVGAICLSSAATEFEHRGAENQTNGYLRQSGIFLFENGEAGTIQHLDMAT